MTACRKVAPAEVWTAALLEGGRQSSKPSRSPEQTLEAGWFRMSSPPFQLQPPTGAVCWMGYLCTGKVASSSKDEGCQQ